MEIQKLNQRYVSKQKLLNKLKQLFKAGEYEMEVTLSRDTLYSKD